MPEKIRCRCGGVFELDTDQVAGPVKCPHCGRETPVPPRASEKRSALDYELDELTLETEESSPVRQADPTSGGTEKPKEGADEPAVVSAAPGEPAEATTVREAAAPQTPGEEEEAEPPHVGDLIRTCLFRPSAISGLDLRKLGQKKVFAGLAVTFLILNSVPAVFDGTRIADGFLSFMKNVPAVFVLRVAAIAAFVGLLKLVMKYYAEQWAPAREVAAAVLLCRILAIVLFTPLALLGILVALLASPPIVRVVMPLSQWVFAGLAFSYQAYLLKGLVGAGCLGVVVANAAGVCATHATVTWILTRLAG